MRADSARVMNSHTLPLPPCISSKHSMQHGQEATRETAAAGSSTAGTPAEWNATLSFRVMANHAGTQTHEMQILSYGHSPNIFTRPCVDCGRVTHCFCDFCTAKQRMPRDVWAEQQRTPLCPVCDERYGRCHYSQRVAILTAGTSEPLGREQAQRVPS